MKFKSIKMTNFMRYKGEHEIIFSCDPEKNVTVVLGDNTFGKTTIAQAFRWGLYGEMISTNYEKKNDIVLLNKEILAGMDANSRKYVIVQINVINDGLEYEFVRKAEFIRKPPQLYAVQRSEQLFMRINNKGKWSDWIDNNGDRTRGHVDDSINVLLPKDLSTYFFFDGERWNDLKTKREDIKASIGTIMGISALNMMKYHLIQHGANGAGSVIKQLKKRTVGTDSRSQEIDKELDFIDKQIETCKERISSAKNAIEVFDEKVRISEEILDANKKIEEEQKEARKLERTIEDTKIRVASLQTTFIKNFSADAHKILLGDLPELARNVINQVDNLEGSEIPGVNDKTIYYILREGRCLCGCEIKENSPQFEMLNKLLNVVPPKQIGGDIRVFYSVLDGLASGAEDKLADWLEAADLIEREKGVLEDLEDDLYRINKRIDSKINFAQERQRMEENKRKSKEQQEIIRKAENNIADYKRRYESLESERDILSQKDAEAKKYRRMVAYAEELLRIAEDNLKEKEIPLRGKLNDKIKHNYEVMFREKEKYAQLGDDYKLHLFYKKYSNYDGQAVVVEETNLSEGEKIACNFVFIVSILELAQESKMESEDDTIVTLPLVLDGPFSKLSADNTKLVARVLPNAAEQVIVFMLDKDWEASGLEQYTDRTFKYRVNKDSYANSSCIEQEV